MLFNTFITWCFQKIILKILCCTESDAFSIILSNSAVIIREITLLRGEKKKNYTNRCGRKGKETLIHHIKVMQNYPLVLQGQQQACLHFEQLFW